MECTPSLFCQRNTSTSSLRYQRHERPPARRFPSAPTHPLPRSTALRIAISSFGSLKASRGLPFRSAGSYNRSRSESRPPDHDPQPQSTLVYELLCLHFPPYLITRTGKGAIIKQIPPRNRKPGPNPNPSTNGGIARGNRVPAKHLTIRTIVIALAEYNPKASTTYPANGTIINSMRNPKNAILS